MLAVDASHGGSAEVEERAQDGVTFHGRAPFPVTMARLRAPLQLFAAELVQHQPHRRLRSGNSQLFLLFVCFNL